MRLRGPSGIRAPLFAPLSRPGCASGPCFVGFAEGGSTPSRVTRPPRPLLFPTIPTPLGYFRSITRRAFFVVHAGLGRESQTTPPLPWGRTSALPWRNLTAESVTAASVVHAGRRPSGLSNGEITPAFRGTGGDLRRFDQPPRHVCVTLGHAFHNDSASSLRCHLSEVAGSQAVNPADSPGACVTGWSRGAGGGLAVRLHLHERHQ